MAFSLYCIDCVASLSGFHPISFARVLHFQSQITDGRWRLIDAEEAHLATEMTIPARLYRRVRQVWLAARGEADNVKSVIGYFGADFFELMDGLRKRRHVYLRSSVYRNCPELEIKPQFMLDTESVYASVGYSLLAGPV